MGKKDKILDRLNKISSVHAKSSTDNCRYAVVAMMGVSWGLLITENNNFPICVPIIVLLLGIVYFVLATLSYFYVAKKARDLHKLRDNDEVDNVSTITLMNIQTDKAFELQSYLNAVCLIMALTLIIGTCIYLAQNNLI